MCPLEPGQGGCDGASIYDPFKYESDEPESVPEPTCIECGENVLYSARTDMPFSDLCPSCWAFDQMYRPGQGANPYRVAKQMSEITGKPLSECLDIVWPEAWNAMHIRIDDICYEINKLKEALQ